VSEERLQKRNFGSKGKKINVEDGENYVMRRSMVCTCHQMLIG
jgi:hypothetical protein